MKKTRFISLLLCLCMVMSLFAGLTVTASADDGVINYTVVKGDYLLKICMRHGLNYYQCKGIIMVLNGFTTEKQLNRISPGQVIKLPASNSYTGSTPTVTVVSSTPAKTTASVAGSNLSGYSVGYYLVPVAVKSGDTLNGICSKMGTDYNTYASQILAINGLKNANSISVGKTLWIPSLTAPSSGDCYGVVAHTVASGENVTDICAKYGVNYLGSKQMVDGMNPSLNLNKIYAGQVINIPVKTTGGTTSTIGTKINSDETSTNALISGYQINFNTTTNGNPYAVVGGKNFATRAPAGTSVVIIPNAKDGYTVESIKVLREDGGGTVEVTNTSFTMPESNVNITVKYKQGLKLQKEASKNGTFETLVHGSAATVAGFGDEIVIKPIPDAGYSISKVEYAGIQPATAYQNVLPDKTTGVYSFNMPNYANGTKVKVTFAKTQMCTLMDLTSSFGGKVKFLVNGSAVTKAEKNTNVTIIFEPDSGWVFDNTAFESQFNNNFTINSTPMDFVTLHNPPRENIKKIDETTYSLFIDSAWTSFSIAPPAGVALFNNYNAYVLNRENSQYGSISFNVTDSRTGDIRIDTTWARQGDTVEIIPHPNETNPNDNYPVVNTYVPTQPAVGWARWRVTSTSPYTAVANLGDNTPPSSTAEQTYRPLGTDVYTTNPVTGIAIATWNPARVGYEFTMPGNNVLVKAQFFPVAVRPGTTSQQYNVYGGNYSEGKISVTDVAGNPISTARVNDTINFTVTSTVNWIADKAFITVNGAGRVEVPLTAVAGVQNQMRGTFLMPNNGTMIQVEFKQKYNQAQVNAAAQDYLNDPLKRTTIPNTFGEPVTLLADGQRVPLGSVVPLERTLEISYTLDNRDPLQKVELDRVELVYATGVRQKLTPDGDGKYRHKITTEDIAPANQPITFTVITKTMDNSTYSVVHSLAGIAPGAGQGSYELYNVTKGVSVTNANLTNVDVDDEIIVRNIIPPTGSVFKDIVISGVDYWVDGGNYRFIMPDQNVSVLVNFDTAAKPYTITYTGLAGAATCSPYTAVEGTGIIISITPDTPTAGNITGTYTVGGGPATAFTATDPDGDGTYTFTFAGGIMPSNNVTVDVTGMPYNLTVAAVSGGGTATVPADKAISYGTSETLTFTPNAGSYLEKVVINGTDYVANGTIPEAGGSVTINPVVGNINVSEIVCKKYIDIAVTVSGTGTVLAPSPETGVKQGVKTFSFEADAGSHLVSVVIDGVDYVANGMISAESGSVTLTVSANVNIVVTCDLNT